MKRILWTTPLLVVLGVAFARWEQAPDAGTRTGADAAAPVSASAPPASATSPVAPSPVAAAPPTRPEPVEPLPLPDDLSPEKRAFIESHPELRERARQHALAAEADARWEEAVARGRYTPRDLDPAVRDAFRAVTLEPRYAEGGRIDGLVIEAMRKDHPFAKAGLRPGDLIDRLQGTPLRDPAELPSLLSHLGPRLDLCVRRGEESFCREIVLP